MERKRGCRSVRAGAGTNLNVSPMPKKMSALPKSRRAWSDEGARRKASWGKPAHEYEHGKRYTKWLCDPGDVCRPMDAELGAFQENPNWKIFRIMAEFIEGFEFLDKLHSEVTIFGSARANVEDEWYQKAKKLGFLLAKAKFTVITGGGP